MFTSSDFDHVAIVLKYKKQLDQENEEKLYFIDATSTNGVSVNKWSDIRLNYGPDLFYQNIVYRSVDFNRTENILCNLENFLEETISCDYGLSIGKLLRKKSITKQKC